MPAGSFSIFATKLAIICTGTGSTELLFQIPQGHGCEHVISPMATFCQLMTHEKQISISLSPGCRGSMQQLLQSLPQESSGLAEMLACAGRPILMHAMNMCRPFRPSARNSRGHSVHTLYYNVCCTCPSFGASFGPSQYFPQYARQTRSGACVANIVILSIMTGRQDSTVHETECNTHIADKCRQAPIQQNMRCHETRLAVVHWLLGLFKVLGAFALAMTDSAPASCTSCPVDKAREDYLKLTKIP